MNQIKGTTYSTAEDISLLLGLPVDTDGDNIDKMIPFYKLREKIQVPVRRFFLKQYIFLRDVNHEGI